MCHVGMLSHSVCVNTLKCGGSSLTNASTKIGRSCTHDGSLVCMHIISGVLRYETQSKRESLCLHPCLSPCCYPSLSLRRYTVHLQDTNIKRVQRSLPSTDAKRKTVKEISVNICSMSMTRLAERTAEQSVTSPSMAASLYTSLPISHSLSVLPSPPPLPLLIHFNSFST